MLVGSATPVGTTALQVTGDGFTSGNMTVGNTVTISGERFEVHKLAAQQEEISELKLMMRRVNQLLRRGGSRAPR